MAQQRGSKLKRVETIRRDDASVNDVESDFAGADEAVADVHRVASPVMGTKRTGKTVRFSTPWAVFSTTVSC